jgi:hypothetical protein
VEIRASPPITLTRVASVAACFVLLVSLGIFTWLWNTTNYYICVDMNPSVELQINGFGRLRAATPLNEGGAELLDELDMRATAESIVVAMISLAEQEGLLAASNATEVLVTVVKSRDRSPEMRMSSIGAALEEHGMLEFTMVKYGSTYYRYRAAGYGISTGRLRLASRLKYLTDEPIQIDELRQMQITDLFAAVEKAERYFASSR